MEGRHEWIDVLSPNGRVQLCSRCDCVRGHELAVCVAVPGRYESYFGSFHRLIRQKRKGQRRLMSKSLSRKLARYAAYLWGETWQIRQPDAPARKDPWRDGNAPKKKAMAPIEPASQIAQKAAHEVLSAESFKDAVAQGRTKKRRPKIETSIGRAARTAETGIEQTREMYPQVPSPAVRMCDDPHEAAFWVLQVERALMFLFEVESVRPMVDHLIDVEADFLDGKASIEKVRTCEQNVISSRTCQDYYRLFAQHRYAELKSIDSFMRGPILDRAFINLLSMQIRSIDEATIPEAVLADMRERIGDQTMRDEAARQRELRAKRRLQNTEVKLLSA